MESLLACSGFSYIGGDECSLLSSKQVHTELKCLSGLLLFNRDKRCWRDWLVKGKKQLKLQLYIELSDHVDGI